MTMTVVQIPATAPPLRVRPVDVVGADAVDCHFAGATIPAGVRAYLCLRLPNGYEIDGRFARFARRAPKVFADDVSRLCGCAIFWPAMC
jgi:hypothetical protein